MPRTAAQTPRQGVRDRVRRAVVTVLALLGVMWCLKLVAALDPGLMLTYGITPRREDGLVHIFTAPFLHLNFGHLVGNSIPLAVLGFLAALRGLVRFLAITLVVIVVSGLGVWLVAPTGSVTLGASGIVFGYFAYLVVRGFLDLRLGDIAIGLLVLLLYGGILWGVLPTHRDISWQAHLFGLLGGLLAAWMLRRRPTRGDGM
ncbi:rhomboid family intramembrane serine protease [Carbonactinospora thermoautotrophica]|nr:rhomboid family intramembrane serine protease [Carbonactinospora thermoautotrophica]